MFVQSFSIALTYCARWFGCTNVETLARFKSILSDVQKTLAKSFERPDPNQFILTPYIEELSSDVRDRIGIRLITDTDSENELFGLWTLITDVFCGFNIEAKDEFLNWFTKSTEIPQSHKRLIREALSVPTSVRHFKNYVTFPKNNQYQALQGTFGIPFYSSFIPGLQFELQLKSEDMDRVATSGEASHAEYKRKWNTMLPSLSSMPISSELRFILINPTSLCRCHLNTTNHCEVEID